MSKVELSWGKSRTHTKPCGAKNMQFSSSSRQAEFKIYFTVNSFTISFLIFSFSWISFPIPIFPCKSILLCLRIRTPENLTKTMSTVHHLGTILLWTNQKQGNSKRGARTCPSCLTLGFGLLEQGLGFRLGLHNTGPQGPLWQSNHIILKFLCLIKSVSVYRTIHNRVYRKKTYEIKALKCFRNFALVKLKFDSSEEKTINHVVVIKRRQKSKYWTVLYITVSVRTKATTATVARLKPATQVFTPITKSINKKYLQFYKEIHW